MGILSIAYVNGPQLMILFNVLHLGGKEQPSIWHVGSSFCTKINIKCLSKKAILVGWQGGALVCDGLMVDPSLVGDREPGSLSTKCGASWKASNGDGGISESKPISILFTNLQNFHHQ